MILTSLLGNKVVRLISNSDNNYDPKMQNGQIIYIIQRKIIGLNLLKWLTVCFLIISLLIYSSVVQSIPITASPPSSPSSSLLPLLLTSSSPSFPFRIDHGSQGFQSNITKYNNIKQKPLYQGLMRQHNRKKMVPKACNRVINTPLITSVWSSFPLRKPS